MSRLNLKLPDLNVPDSTNRAGGKAYSQTTELALISLLLTSFFSDNNKATYESDRTRINRLFEMVGNVTPQFAAKCAVYARDKFGMRTASHLVAMALGKVKFPEKARFYEKIIHRPDDMLEIAAGILSQDDGKLPNALKKGFSAALRRFNEYELTKYKGEGKLVNLYDIINLVHPRPTNAITSIIKGTYQAPETWEVGLTQAGVVEEGLTEEEKEATVSKNKLEIWTKLLNSGKLGYMALLRNLSNIIQIKMPLLRNLSNIIQTKDETLVKLACEQLLDLDSIKRSRILPFRFLTAYTMLEKLGNNRISTSIAKAFDLAMSNAPVQSGATLIAVDQSGSMVNHLIANGVNARELSLVFALGYMKGNPDTDLMMFSDDATYVNGLDLSSSSITLSKSNSIPRNSRGTNFQCIFEKAKRKYDRIIIISDGQGWQWTGAPTKAHKEYCKKFETTPQIFSWDIAGYGDMMFREDKVITLAGWMGDRVYELMNIVQGGLGGIVNEVNKVEL